MRLVSHVLSGGALPKQLDCPHGSRTSAQHAPVVRASTPSMATPVYINKPLGTCYALRYPDLLAGFCGGVPSRCDFAGLLDHWNTHGRAGPQPHSITRHPLPLPLLRTID